MVKQGWDAVDGSGVRRDDVACPAAERFPGEEVFAWDGETAVECLAGTGGQRDGAGGLLRDRNGASA